MDQFPRELLRTWAKSKPTILALGVFGSRARSAATRTSDLDLWIELSLPEEDRLLSFLDNRGPWSRELEMLTGLVVRDLELRGVSCSADDGIEIFRREQ